MSDIQTREINLGRITGKSAYELAIDAGTFSGTLEEYNTREQKMFETFGDCEKMISENTRKYGEVPSGSWFTLNNVKTMDDCFEPVGSTYISPTTVDDLVVKRSDDLVMFECKVTYLANNAPATIRQDIYFTENRQPVHMWRYQSCKGVPQVDLWSEWEIT